jgi:hypothetical protein
MTYMPDTGISDTIHYICWWFGAVTPGEYLLFRAEMFVGVVICATDAPRRGHGLRKALSSS